MSRVRKLVEELQSRSEVVVEDRRDAWLVRIPRGLESACEVTIPKERFEWFASVKRLADHKEVWSDWTEHYGSPEAQLDAEMADDILAFVERAKHEDSPLSLYETEA